MSRPPPTVVPAPGAPTPAESRPVSARLGAKVTASAGTASPCPTCTYPSRETVNMVCQTCGWDYSKGEKP